MKALIVGATGATGIDLLHLLLQDDTFDEVVIFVRRNPGISHKKLQVNIIDFDIPEAWQDLVTGDVLFSCLGTTLKDAGSKEAQWKIDYDYQLQFAQAARNNNVLHYILVFSRFASPKALFFYPRMKGQLEKSVEALGFPRLSIFNPPVLVRKGSKRMGELIGLKAIQLLNKAGLFLNSKPLRTEELAQAMIDSAKLR